MWPVMLSCIGQQFPLWLEALELLHNVYGMIMQLNVTLPHKLVAQIQLIKPLYHPLQHLCSLENG